MHRIRICRKEGKESCLWLRLCDAGDSGELGKERQMLISEEIELREMFTSILVKSK